MQETPETLDDKLDFPQGRYERKYLMTDETAVALRDAIKPFVEFDVHMPPNSVRGYPVYSLYFDSPSLELYRHTREGRTERFKLRVRFYDHQGAHKAYVEIKEKQSGQTFKRRYGVDRALAEAMLADPQAEPVVRALNNGAKGTALEEFCRLRGSVGADPKLFIAYDREAYNSKEEPQVRVTFDRRVKANAFGRQSGLSVPRYGVSVGGLNVLVEFKYAGDPPAWLVETLETFVMRRASFSKFAECVDALGLSGQSPQKFKLARKR